MKFERTEVFNFAGAIRGMRNPKDSWHLSDSGYVDIDDAEGAGVYLGTSEVFVIGPKDMILAQALIKGGSEHRKFMRQIFVTVDITAPLFWWKEFDTYKVGTTANSTSTMHTIQKKEITINNFEIDDYCENAITSKEEIDYLIQFLEGLRYKYVATKDKKIWKELIRWLPESWLQTRTVTMSYENIYSMCGHRSHHKLNEWSGCDNWDSPNFVKWARSLPYSKELLFNDEELTLNTK